MIKEIRFAAELRAAAGDELVLEGYAATFNSESKDLGGFVEIIAPGAFSRSLADNADVKCLFNHNADAILGRTKSGTLALQQDEKGLKFRCQLDAANQDHVNLHASVKRGDVDECSFAFMVSEDGQSWAEKVNAQGELYIQRTLKDVDLYDVSAVTYPAYNETSVDARAKAVFDVTEIRSHIDKATKRSRADSLEAQLYSKQDAICDALLQQFGYVVDYDYMRKFYLIETYADHVIAESFDPIKDGGTYSCFLISYTMENGAHKFGEPKAVELDWVPASERVQALRAETRAVLAAEITKRNAAPAAEAVVVPAENVTPVEAPAAEHRAPAEVAAVPAAEAPAAEETPAVTRSAEDCQCPCDECLAGDCDDCSDEGCECVNCDCDQAYRARTMRKLKLAVLRN